MIRVGSTAPRSNLSFERPFLAEIPSGPSQARDPLVGLRRPRHRQGTRSPSRGRRTAPRWRPSATSSCRRTRRVDGGRQRFGGVPKVRSAALSGRVSRQEGRSAPAALPAALEFESGASSAAPEQRQRAGLPGESGASSGIRAAPEGRRISAQLCPRCTHTARTAPAVRSRAAPTRPPNEANLCLVTPISRPPPPIGGYHP